VAQAAKDRAAQVLSEANLSFAKMAEMIEQRRLLLRPRIIAGIKAHGSARHARRRGIPRRRQRAAQRRPELFVRLPRPSNSIAPDPSPDTKNRCGWISARVRWRVKPVMPPGFTEPAWLRALFFVAGIILFPLRHPIRFLALVLVAILLFYALRGFVSLGQQASAYSDGVGAIRHGADRALSSS